MNTFTSFKAIEPYFILVEDSDHFRILCTSLDFDDNAEEPVLLKEEVLIIKKDGCGIYERSKRNDD